MICCHLLMNTLQYFNILELIFDIIKITAPNLTCDDMLAVYFIMPYHFIGVSVLALVDQSLTYYICYKYGVINERIQVTTGRMIEEFEFQDKDSSFA